MTENSSERKMEFVGVKLPHDLRERVELAARAERRSVSGFIRNVLADMVEAADRGDSARAA